MKILIAEDDRVSRIFLEVLLKKLGHTVTACEHGSLALQAYQRAADYRIVISDWMMPHMSGLDLCRAIRGLNRPDYCYFIMATSKARKADFLEAMSAGADDYILKPVGKDDLVARLVVAEKALTLMRLKPRRSA